MEKILLIYDEEVNYNLSQKHPMNPTRIKLTYRLIEALGLLDKLEVVKIKAPLAYDQELKQVHSENYIEAVKEAAKGKHNWHFGLGTSDNPIFPEIHNSSAKIAGASLLAAKMLLKNEVIHAFNPWGGLHHALANRASGFCIYNDAAIAISYLRKEGKRIAYIDIDAHHGDGVQWIFYDDPQVLTISIHESGYYLFPGTGFENEKGNGKGTGYSINVPLDPNSTEADYLLAIRELVKPLIESFKPDILVTQNGCDSLERDPLSHLRVSLKGFFEMVKELHQIAHQLVNGKILALGGGGYDAYYSVPIAWASLFANLCHFELPELIPQSYFKDLSQYLNLKAPLTFFESQPIQKEALPETRKTVERLKSELFV